MRIRVGLSAGMVVAATTLTSIGSIPAYAETAAGGDTRIAIAKCVDEIWDRVVGSTPPPAPAWMKSQTAPAAEGLSARSVAAMQQAGRDKVGEWMAAASETKTGEDGAIEITGTIPLSGGMTRDGLGSKFYCRYWDDFVRSTKWELFGAP